MAHLLIIEDDADLRKALKYGLKDQGYMISGAATGPKGLEKARNGDYDLIILDLMLPKIDGYKVCRFLKFDERYRHIPIIMLTARAQESEQALGMETGADEYITKPYDPEYLLSKLRRYLPESGQKEGF